MAWFILSYKKYIMKKNIIIISLFLLLGNMAFTQVSFTLSGSNHSISPNLIGINGRSTSGPSWSDQNFLDLVEQLNPGTIRYPAGTQANYWDWRTGTFIEGCGKTSSYIFSIPMFVNGLPEKTSIIYVVNIARPTPITGVSFEASDEILKSEATLQLKIDDILAALAKFEELGKLPEAIEVGNEFYFTNEHAAIYAGNPDLYLVHSKVVCEQVKEKYPNLKILLITTKGGSTSRDYWNNTIFDALDEDADFKSNIHAVVQHHYISDNYGDLTEVSNINTAKIAIAEGIKYTREHQSDYDIIPDGISLWLTEYGATKENAIDTWASGLRAVAMTLGWMEKGDKINRFIYHHITDDPEMINTNEMKLGAVGMAYGLLAKAALDKTQLQKINIAQNPLLVTDIEALYAFLFKNDEQESVFILNTSSETHQDINLENLFTYKGQIEGVSYWNSTSHTRPTYESVGIESDFFSEKTITIKPYSVSLLSVERGTYLGTNNFKHSQEYSIYPTAFTEGFNLIIDKKSINAKLSVIDILGQKVYSNVLKTVKSFHSPTLISGIYFYEIISESEKYSGRIIKK